MGVTNGARRATRAAAAAVVNVALESGCILECC